MNAIEGPVVAASKPRLAKILASPKMLAIMALGAASGYPNQLTESALQAWLKDIGASNTAIGIMTYVSLPYLLKPLWAPLIDRYPLPFLGRRRGWMLAMQLALAVAIAALALQNPATALVPFTVCATAIVFFSATQDIAIDAWRADIVVPEERGLAAAATNVGYRPAAWIAAAFALIVADHLGWRVAFLVLALVMALFCIVSVLAPEPRYQQGTPRSLTESVAAPLKQLFGTSGATALILLVVSFKIGDAFSQKLFTPFMMDTGFTKTEVALIAKSMFTAGAVVGSVMGGVLMVRLGLVRAMLGFGILQAASNLLYCVLAAVGKNYAVMVTAVLIEHIAAGMGGIALVALIMALCDPRYSAFQFAVLSALAVLPRYALGYPAGWVADHAGWYTYYVVSVALALPGLAMVWGMRWRIDALDHRRSAA